MKTVEAVDSAFGNHAFQRWLPDRDMWRAQVLASLFDAEMFASIGLDPQHLASQSEIILERTKHLFNNTEFRGSIDAATNTPSFFRRRIESIKEILTNA